MNGFQNLNDAERETCAKLATRAGLSLLDASYIWLGFNSTLIMHLRTGVDVLVAAHVECRD